MKLSIIIVNYNVADYLRRCLKSIEEFIQEIDYEVIVIDNNSTDTSWKSLIYDFPKVYFIKNLENEGFSRANNKAVREAKGKYILLLNPDTELEDFHLNEVIDFADSKVDFGCLGTRMHDIDGCFLPESKRSVPDAFNSFEKLFLNFRKNSRKSYYRNDIQETEIAEVDVVTGAFLLCKRETYEKLGGLDEAYFMYGEDIDLCYTFLKNGFKNYYYGAYSILHRKGESTTKDKIYLNRFYGAMQIFVDKYYKKQKPFQHQILSFGLKLKHFFEKQNLS